MSENTASKLTGAFRQLAAADSIQSENAHDAIRRLCDPAGDARIDLRDYIIVAIEGNGNATRGYLDELKEAMAANIQELQDMRNVPAKREARIKQLEEKIARLDKRIAFYRRPARLENALSKVARTTAQNRSLMEAASSLFAAPMTIARAEELMKLIYAEKWEQEFTALLGIKKKSYTDWRDDPTKKQPRSLPKHVRITVRSLYLRQLT